MTSHVRWRRAMLAGLVGLQIPGLPLGAQDEGTRQKQGPGAQQAAASRTAKFGSVERSDAEYRGALAATDLTGAARLIGKPGAFKGKVDRVFESARGEVVVLNFAKDYKTALTAVLRKENFARFPDMRTLTGKEVLITGPFVEYRGQAEIVLSQPEQIRLVRQEGTE